MGTYTPFDLLTTNRIIIAPFFADIDTRSGGSEPTRYGRSTLNGRPAFGVNWIDVGYFPSRADKLNSIQLIMVDRSDIAPGDFDFEFNYNQIQWETGGASGGVDGLGGASARVGFSNGVDTSFELPGSAINGAFLDNNQQFGLTNNSLNSNVIGRYVFQVRNGQVIEPDPTPTQIPIPTQPPVLPTDAPQPIPTVPPPMPECASIDNTVSSVVRAFLAGSATIPYCNIIAENGSFVRTTAEVGVQSVLERGVIHAVDVFTVDGGSVNGTTICLQGTGDLFFLDARTAPRTVVPLPGSMNAGFTCASIPAEGTVVLVQGSGTMIEPESAAPASSTQGLSNCRVTTNNILNLRAEASMDGEVITTVPYNTTLQATERVPGWIRVIFMDTQGWLSEYFLTEVGDCQ